MTAVFHARSEGGFVLGARTSSGLVRVRKRAVEVGVEPVLSDLTLQTPEGPLRLGPGDVVLDDGEGRRWGMSRQRLTARYEPLDALGKRWRSLPVSAQALRMTQDFEVRFVDDAACLRGVSGDWLLDYGDGSLGIVAAEVFDVSYDIVGAAP